MKRTSIKHPKSKVTAASRASQNELKRVDNALSRVADLVEMLSEEAYQDFVEVTGLTADTLLDAHMDLNMWINPQQDDFLE